MDVAHSAVEKLISAVTVPGVATTLLGVGATVSIVTAEASVVAVTCVAGLLAISEKPSVIAATHWVSDAVSV